MKIDTRILIGNVLSMLRNKVVANYLLVVKDKHGETSIQIGGDGLHMYDEIEADVAAIVRRAMVAPASAPAPDVADDWYKKVFVHNHTDAELLTRKRKAKLFYPAVFEHETPEAEVKFTCEECVDKRKCPFSFDAYNISGDCLAIK